MRPPESVLTPFKSPVISQHIGAIRVNGETLCFNPVQKSGHIPTPVQALARVSGGVLTPFKSPVISQRYPGHRSPGCGGVLTPFKSPVISQRIFVGLLVAWMRVLTPFKSPVISQHYRDFRGVVGGLGFNPVQKSGHIPTKIVTAILAVMFCFNPVQKSGHIPTLKHPLISDNGKSVFE